MNLILKDPGASLDYAIDWGPEYLDDDQIGSSSWTTSPIVSGGLAILSSSHDGRVATVKINGGIAGHVYQLTNIVSTILGRADQRSLTIRVEEQ